MSGKREFIYYPGTRRIPDALLPNLVQSYRMTADLIIPENGAEGVMPHMAIETLGLFGT